MITPSVDNSVWFAWTPIFSGPAEFDTFGSDFDTVLAVYTTPSNLSEPEPDLGGGQR